MKMQKKQEEMEALVVDLSKKFKVEIFFPEPNDRVNVDVGNAPVTGNKDAKVTIIVFSDFECPFCSRVVPTLDRIKKEYKNKVRIAFKHYPLPIHQNAKGAAIASMCVYDQNAEKFWAYHDKLFQNQQNLKPEELAKYAKEVGVNEAKFKECVASDKYLAHVNEDLQYGSAKIGLKSTPSFFINGRPLAGALPFEAFKEKIDEELARAK